MKENSGKRSTVGLIMTDFKNQKILADGDCETILESLQKRPLAVSLSL